MHYSNTVTGRSTVNTTRSRKTGLWGFRERAVQPLKATRDLKYLIQKEEVFYYLCCENKSVDQLRTYCTADQRPWFRICENPVFLDLG